MSGTFWTTEELAKLRNEWTNRRADITAREFAETFSDEIGRTPTSIRMKLSTLKEYSIPSSNRTAWNNPPMIEGNALIMGDTQIPFHHAEFMNKCFAVCKKLGVTQLILAGDVLDFAALSSFTPDFEAEGKRVIDQNTAKDIIEIAQTLPFDKRELIYNLVSEAESESGLGGEIKEARTILKIIETMFDAVVWIMGNHEKRVLNVLQKTIPVDSLANVFGADDPKWKVSPYYHCILKSNGVEYKIEHPKNSAKGSSKKLASKFTSNIVMFHNHHFNITTDPSGQWLAIEPGMVMDEERMPYASQRHDTSDTHIVGALLVIDGKPIPLNKFTPWDLLLK